MWNKIDVYELNNNVFSLIGKEWMLITGGDEKENNCMTASWGGMGILWHKPVAFLFVRPERYTHKFTETDAPITLSFFSEEYRDALTYCGRNSGRDGDKAAACKWDKCVLPEGGITYEQADLAMSLRKLYRGCLEESEFIDTSVLKHYQKEGYHTVYICEIIGAYRKN